MQNIIFDLNGVFIKSEYLTVRMEKLFGVPTDESYQALKTIMNQVRRANAPSLFSLWKPYFKKWGVDFDEQEFLDWYFTGESLDEEMYEYAKSLKELGNKIFFLSNNFKERTEYYRKIFPKLFQLADKSYFSWETDLVKPDKEVYQMIISDNTLDPQETYYLDDSEENLVVASSMGINSLKITGKTTIKEIDAFLNN